MEIRTTQLEIEQAREVKRQVFTKYFPQVNLAGLGYYSVNPLIHFSIEDIQSNDMRELLQSLYELVAAESDVRNEVSLMKKGASGSVLAIQPLYAGGRIVTGNKLATLGVEAAELQARMKMRDIIENVESTYYLVAGLQQKVATVTAALTLIDSLDRTVQLALDNGLVTRADALQLQLKRNEMLANQQQLASGIRLSKRLLCTQIGIEYSDTLTFADPLMEMTALPDFVYSTVGDSLRPETRLLQLSVEAEWLQRRLTLGEALPQLTLIGSAYYGNMIKNDASANAVALLSLSVPLSGWWETSHKLKQHDIRIQEARIRQDYYNHMMSLEEEKAYSDMLDAAVLLKSDSAALEIAQENYRLSVLNYQAGVITLTEVLQAQALLLQAQNAITDRQTTFVTARRRLMDLRNQ
ncbi:MAG: TolC family protein [Bacteroidales bacterium]|nr:TolC family protein [Bacteroidales bacterium]